MECNAGYGAPWMMVTPEKIRGIIFDIDGTLFRGESPLVDLKELFYTLERKNLEYVVATNNTKSAKDYQKRFQRYGIEIKASHILTCAQATAEYLKQKDRECQWVYVIGKDALKEEIRQRGFQVLYGRERQAEIVVVGGDFELDYQKLKNAILHIQDGAKLVGTNPDLLIPTEEGLLPEAGTTLAAIEAATGIHPTVIGKPEPILFAMAVQRMKLRPEQVLMIGDRLDTDIRGAKRAGLHAALVETGVDTRKNVIDDRIQPDIVLKNLDELICMLNEGE